MSSPNLKDLISGLQVGNVIPVIGAGVSMQTANMPSWYGALNSALNHIASTGSVSAEQIDEIKLFINQGSLVTAAKQVQRLMGAPFGEYPFWLKSAFERKEITNCSLDLIKSIENLLCPFIATTNYDRLLSQVILNKPESITWRQPSLMQQALREGGRILHLHGVYTDPNSVIFGIDDYTDLGSNEVYQQVLRSLWIERTLLFIGCSFDGLRDPDFTKLLDWATFHFKGSPFKHYALIRESDVDSNKIREFLIKWRIQTIPFGPTHNELPLKIQEINPNVDKAIALRTGEILTLIKNEGPQIQKNLRDALSALPKPILQPALDLQLLATTILSKNRATNEKLKNDLINIQNLACSVINLDMLSIQLDLWEKNQIKKFEGEFQNAVITATSILSLIPDDLMNALKRRGVDIHQRWLDGFCKQLLQDFLVSNYQLTDNYSLENAKRILSTLRAILRSDAMSLFKSEIEGIMATNEIQPPFLVVARDDKVELRKPDSPDIVVASLNLNNRINFSTLDTIAHKGENVICICNREHMYIWNPKVARTPFVDFEVQEPYGINGVCHRFNNTATRTYITTISGPVYELEDFIVKKKWNPIRNGFLTHPILLQNENLYALIKRDLPVIEIEQGAYSKKINPLIDKESLKTYISNCPGLLPNIDMRLSKDMEQLKTTWPEMAKKFDRTELNFQWPSLHSVKYNNENLLVLRIGISFITATSTLILLFNICNNSVQVKGHFYLDNARITNFHFFEDSDGSLRIVYALLSDFKETYDLIGWARAFQTANNHLLFISQDSTLKTYDDMIDVERFSNEMVFASDDSGGLFKLSLTTKHFEEIDRNKMSKIKSLRILG